MTDEDRISRRGMLKLTGGAATSGILMGNIQTARAAEKPSMRWEPAHETNYTNGYRDPSDVDYIVLHTLEGPYDDNIRYFEKNNIRDVSAHFVVSYEGEITKMVNVEDIAHTQKTFNSNSIGIEMEGYASENDTTEAMYNAVAKLVRYLAEEWGVNKVHPDGLVCGSPDSGIIGHNQIPNSSCTDALGGKTDPGPYWDWNYFMNLVNNGDGGSGGEPDQPDYASYDWPVYEYGDQGPDVYAIQCLLEHNGYDLYYHDGIYGSEVYNHVRYFQSNQGLSVDGIVGPNTWSELAPTLSRDNASGDWMWGTWAVQHNLVNSHGYNISVDGYYGPETEGAVEQFQKESNIAVDGIVGPNTWKALMQR